MFSVNTKIQKYWNITDLDDKIEKFVSPTMLQSFQTDPNVSRNWPTTIIFDPT